MNASIASMTAFAHHETPSIGGSLVWEIRSVNHRYLELSFRLPDTFRQWEGPLREQIRQHLHRGKIECQLKWQSHTGPEGLAINTNKLTELQNLLQQFVWMRKHQGSSLLHHSFLRLSNFLSFVRETFIFLVSQRKE